MSMKLNAFLFSLLSVMGLTGLTACSNYTFVDAQTLGDAAPDSLADAGPELESSPEGDQSDAGVSDAVVGDASDGEDGYSVPTKLRVFITSMQWDGNLGGITGADAKCEAAALSGKLGSAGKWMAWISTSTNSPALRFQHGSVPYVLVDGTTEVASDWAHLTGGFALEHLIDQDEFGQSPSFGGQYPGYVMTSTNDMGMPSLQEGACLDYTSDSVSVTTTAGYYLSQSTQGWTLDSEFYCNDVAALYCFEQF